MTKVVELIKRSEENINEFGVPKAKDVVTRILGTTLNFGSREYLEAMATGLKPELKIEIPKGVFTGQTSLIFGGLAYEISRTYERNDKLEITCYRNVVSEDE